MILHVKMNTKEDKKGAVFCSYKIDGGGNQSGKKLAELLGYDFVDLNKDEWKEATHPLQHRYDPWIAFRRPWCREFGRLATYLLS